MPACIPEGQGSFGDVDRPDSRQRSLSRAGSLVSLGEPQVASGYPAIKRTPTRASTGDTKRHATHWSSALPTAQQYPDSSPVLYIKLKVSARRTAYIWIRATTGVGELTLRQYLRGEYLPRYYI